jgi:L-fuculose-phosphate aldolase
MGHSVNEQELREKICFIGQLMYRNQYIDGASGNISARLDNDRILVTPSGLAKGFLTPDQLLIINMAGESVDKDTPDNQHLRPTSETVMHLECYRRRPDVMGVVHAHPPTLIALSIAGYSLQNITIPEIIVLLGAVPTLPYAPPASEQNRIQVSEAIRHYDALILAYHGSLTVGATVWEAYLRLESIEHVAKILSIVHQLNGNTRSLTYEQVEELLTMRNKLMNKDDKQTILSFYFDNTFP